MPKGTFETGNVKKLRSQQINKQTVAGFKTSKCVIQQKSWIGGNFSPLRHFIMLIVGSVVKNKQSQQTNYRIEC